MQGQGLDQKSQGQALAGIIVGNSGRGAEFFGQPLAERIGASGPGIGHHSFQGVVEVKALKNQIPERDDGSEQPLIKSLVFEAGQPPKLASGQQTEEEAQQLPGRERTWAGGGRGLWRGRNLSVVFGSEGVFFDCALYVSNNIYISL